MHQVALVELVDPLQCLPDQTDDLSLRQQLLGHTVIKDLAARRAEKKKHEYKTRDDQLEERIYDHTA